MPSSTAEDTLSVGETGPGSSGQGQQGGGVQFNWAISAGALNALWGDLFPRLVAKQWLHELNPGSESVVFTGMDKQQLKDSVQKLWGSGAQGASVAPLPRDLPLSGQMAALLGHKWTARDRIDFGLEALTVQGAPPFKVAVGGGFDFLLSDEGIEFCFPDKPESLREFVRYYSFRNTGRPVIGLPLYLKGPCTAAHTDMPSGPSQAKVPVEWLEPLRDRPQALPEGLEAVVNRLLESDEIATISIGTYGCIQGSVREWQIQGSVYRAIMSELPRVVALAWMEYLDNATGAQGAYYPRLFGAPGQGGSTPSKSGLDMLAGTNENGGLRDVFRHRLETALPDVGAMDFGVLAQNPSRPGWDPDDVMITDAGFYFPKPNGMENNDDHLKALLSEIAGGRAGNPVFTNSTRTGN